MKPRRSEKVRPHYCHSLRPTENKWQKKRERAKAIVLTPPKYIRFSFRGMPLTHTPAIFSCTFEAKTLVASACLPLHWPSITLDTLEWGRTENCIVSFLPFFDAWSCYGYARAYTYHSMRAETIRSMQLGKRRESESGNCRESKINNWFSQTCEYFSLLLRPWHFNNRYRISRSIVVYGRQVGRQTRGEQSRQCNWFMVYRRRTDAKKRERSATAAAAIWYRFHTTALQIARNVRTENMAEWLREIALRGCPITVNRIL